MPQASFEDIIEDCKDSLAWCIMELPSILGKDNIDIDCYVVGGDSAGGTLSTLSGHLLEPKPKVVIDVFGLVDSLDLPEQRFPPLPYSLAYDNLEEVMERAKMDRDPTKAETICPWYWEFPGEMDPADLRSFWGMPEFETTDKHLFRMDLNNYIQMKDERFAILYRKDRFASEEEYIEYQKSMSPFHLLDKAESYPPTFVLHGTADTPVPVEQSYKFVEKLKAKGIEVDARYKEGGEHCFENKIEVSDVVCNDYASIVLNTLQRPGDDGWDEFIVPCMDFVDKHVRR